MNEDRPFYRNYSLPTHLYTRSFTPVIVIHTVCATCLCKVGSRRESAWAAKDASGRSQRLHLLSKERWRKVSFSLSLSFFPPGGVKISSPFSVLRTRLSNISRRELVLLGPDEEEEFFPSLMGEKSANGRKKMVGNPSSFRSRWHSISKGIWEKIFVKFYTHKTLKFYAKY